MPSPVSSATALSLNRLWDAHLKMTEALGHVVLCDASAPIDEFPRRLRESAEALDQIRHEIDATIIRTATVVPLDVAVLFVRVLDRGLALASITNLFLKDRAGAQPFQALLLDGTRTMRDALSQLGRTKGRRSLRASGPIVQAALVGRGDFSQVYSFGSVHTSLRMPMALGIAGDCLDLAEDLAFALARAGLGSAAPGNTGVVDVWTQVADKTGDTVPRRNAWPCGSLLTADDAASRLQITEKQLGDLRRARRVLAVPMWDGSLRYPSIQFIHPSQGSTAAARRPRFLGRLLQGVEPSVSPWSLALWLGLRGPRVATQLDREEDLRQICADLAKRGALQRTSRLMPAHGTVAIPNESQLRDQFGKHQPTPFRGMGSRYDARWRGEKAAALQLHLYRVTRRQYGAFHFSSAYDEPPDSRQRFDLNIDGMGTCYFSDTPVGALFEVFSRLLFPDVQELAMYTMWTLHPFEDIDRLFDLRSDSKASAELSIEMDVLYSRSRFHTQQLATDAHSVGFRGVVHPLRSVTSSNGYALFGKDGWSTPEKSGLGSWHAERADVTADKSFAKFLTEQGPARGQGVSYQQLPLVDVLSPR